MNRYVAIKWIVADELKEISESRILRHFKVAQSRIELYRAPARYFHIDGERPTSMSSEVTRHKRGERTILHVPHVDSREASLRKLFWA